MSKPNPKESIGRASRLRWIAVADMKVSPRAQRDYKASRAEKMAADFDLEALGFPVVNKRDGHYYVVDGQHRVGALKLMGWGDQKVQCEVYEGLSEAEEAELFLRRDERTAIKAFDKFQIALVAGREVEEDINRIVQALDLCVSQDDVPGGIRCVGTLKKVYQRSGPEVFARTLRIIRDSYGDSGLEAIVVNGLGLFSQRYNGQLAEDEIVKRLSKAHGGVNGLLGKAETLHKQTGNQKAHCVAAAAVDILNRGKGGKKLPSWWQS